MMAFRVLLLLMLFGLLPAQSQAGGPDISTQQDGACLSGLALEQQLSEFLADLADRINHQEARLLALPEALLQAIKQQQISHRDALLQTMKQQAEQMQELAVMLKAQEVECSMKQGPKAPSAIITGTTGTEASQEQGPERKQREYDPGFLTPLAWIIQETPQGAKDLLVFAVMVRIMMWLLSGPFLGVISFLFPAPPTIQR